MKRSRMLRTVSALGAVAMLATACGSDDTTTTEDPGTGTGDGTVDEPVATGGTFSLFIIEPEHLSVANTNESEGNAVMSALSVGLIDYETETSTPYNAVAESIATEDFQNYTITLKDGWTFHDGTPVTAESFVKSWNYNAYGPNGAQVAGFFSAIDGYEAVNAGDATEMTGLAVVDDKTFTVMLSEANPQWQLSLGYLAYHPVPEAFYADPVAFEEAPIGNGPFMMDGTWEHDVQIAVTKFDAYAGDDKPLVDGVVFQVYADDNTALNDLRAGNLDIIDSVPSDELELVKTEFADTYGTSPRASFNYLGFPEYVYDRSDENTVKMLRALSMGIDRVTINATVLGGASAPADSVIPPVIPGSRGGQAPCEFWVYDADAAKALFEEAGGLAKFAELHPDGMEVWFNTGSTHELWTEAVANNWVSLFGIEAPSFVGLEFSEYLPKLDEAAVTGPFRLGWGMDYPSPQNFLEPLYASDQMPPNGSNNTNYNNPDFDALIAEGNRQATLEDGIPFYQQAEDLICQDVVVAPINFGSNHFATSERVKNVTVDAFGVINYTEIEVVA